MIEYGIEAVGYPEELHRGPMTISEAKTWMKECEEMSMPSGLFTIVFRETSNWQVLEDD